ncbi:unnamed protein product, partial [Heterosigma akashiwo]
AGGHELLPAPALVRGEEPLVVARDKELAGGCPQLGQRCQHRAQLVWRAVADVADDHDGVRLQSVRVGHHFLHRCPVAQGPRMHVGQHCNPETVEAGGEPGHRHLHYPVNTGVVVSKSQGDQADPHSPTHRGPLTAPLTPVRPAT